MVYPSHVESSDTRLGIVYNWGIIGDIPEVSKLMLSSRLMETGRLPNWLVVLDIDNSISWSSISSYD